MLEAIKLRFLFAYLRYCDEGFIWTIKEIFCRLSKFCFYLLFIPLTLILRVFGYRFITVDTSRIGHLAGEADCFLKLLALGFIDERYKFFILSRSSVCNKVFLEYIKKKITVFDYPVVNTLIRFMCVGPGVKFDISNYVLSISKAAKYYEVCREWDNRKPIFLLEEQHKKIGYKVLSDLGVPVGAPYVCIHVRTSGYSTKDDLVHKHRNFNLATFDEAIDEILNRGYYCILMGDSSAQRISTKSKVIDYAHSEYKSDMMDVFFCATTEFFLGNSSGLFILSTVFGRPCALSNMLPFVCTGFTKKDISIPKLLKNSITGEYLKYSQILEDGVANYRNAKQYEMSGIEVISNSGIDIRNLVCDMFAFLDQKISSDEITRKNNFFLKKLQPNSYCFKTSSYIAPSFVEKYKEIFDK
jgi:putative glycosyltransferase (TIGR04372 family)